MEKKDRLVAGLALIGGGLGWFWGAFLPGLLIGAGLGLLLSSTKKQASNADVEVKDSGEEEVTAEGRSASVGQSSPEKSSPEQAEPQKAQTTPPQRHEEPEIEVVWERIIAHQGQLFHQLKGQAFTYQVNGNALTPSTAKAKIYKSQFAKALGAVPFEKVSDVPAGVFGPSYVYAILMDPRIRQDDW